MAGEVVLDMQLLRIAHMVLREIFVNDEPIPEWEEGDRVKLETCSKCTEVEAFDVQKYPDLPSKAAKLFYSTIKTHPFPNGNKRFAFVLTLEYLMINDHQLTAPQGLGYEVATAVADSDPHSAEGRPDKVIDTLSAFFRDHIEEYDFAADPEGILGEDG